MRMPIRARRILLSAVTTTAVASAALFGTNGIASAQPVSPPTSIVDVQIISPPTPPAVAIETPVDPVAPVAPVAPVTPGEGQVTPQALPVIAAAAVAWCASGALGSVPATAISNFLAGTNTAWTNYIYGVVAGCAAGNIGSLAWKLLPQFLKNQAINAAVWHWKTFIARW